jgi:hypothetical protein
LNDSQSVIDDMRGRCDTNGEARALHGMLSTILQYALWHCADAPAGVDFLHKRGAPERLQRVLEINRANLERLKASRQVPVTVLDLVVGEEVHLALLLDDGAAARRAVDMSLAARDLGRVQRDKFWGAYADGLSALLQERPFGMAGLKLSGFQRSLEPYLHLLAAFAAGADPADALRSVDEAFQKRQVDKRSTDWTGVNGDGNRPVRWDFRRTAIVNAARLRPVSPA